MASVPPVEAPIAITLLVVRMCFFVWRSPRTSSDENFSTATSGLDLVAERSLAPRSSDNVHAALYHDVCRSRLGLLTRAQVVRGGIPVGIGPLRRLWVTWRAARRLQRKVR